MTTDRYSRAGVERRIWQLLPALASGDPDRAPAAMLTLLTFIDRYAERKYAAAINDRAALLAANRPDIGRAAS